MALFEWTIKDTTVHWVDGGSVLYVSAVQNTTPYGLLLRGSATTAGSLQWTQNDGGGDATGAAGAVFMAQDPSLPTGTFYAFVQENALLTMELWKFLSAAAGSATLLIRTNTSAVVNTFEVRWIADLARLGGTHIETFVNGVLQWTIQDLVNPIVSSLGQGLVYLATQGGTGATHSHTTTLANITFAMLSAVASSTS